MKARILILFLFTITAVSCTVFSPPATPLPTVSPQQHIILHNGVLLTMDEGRVAGDHFWSGEVEAVIAHYPAPPEPCLKGYLHTALHL